MCSKVVVSHAELRRLLAYNPETGEFVRLVKTGGRYGADVGTVAGGLNDQGRVQVSIHSKRYKAHQLAVFYMTGKWPEGEVDHRDGNPANNRWLNLRDTTPQINQQNRRESQSNNKTGLLGVSWHPRDRRFVARIKTPDGKYRYLGGFNTAEAGHQAYLAAKRELHAGCTI